MPKYFDYLLYEYDYILKNLPINAGKTFTCFIMLYEVVLNYKQPNQ